ncbi:MAG: NAD(P)-dependent alcohol dehydrogenase [Bacteroidota bacterium]
MKAAVCNRYGSPDVLQIEEVDLPIPGANEILIKIITSTVSAPDYRVRSFDVPSAMWLVARFVMGITKPKYPILGAEFSGMVSTVGKSVNRFKVGDEVLGVSLPKFGGYGAYLSIKENGTLVHKPANINWMEAAAIPIGAMTAFYYLDRVKIKKDQRIIVYGASGSVGSYAVQLAKLFGAKVTAVCSAKNFEMVKDLGAEKAFDYKNRNWYKELQDYDVYFQAVDKCPFFIAETVLKEGGTYVNITNPFPSLRMVISTIKKNIKLRMAKDFPQSNDELENMVELIANKKMKVVIDTFFELDNIVEAHQYVDKGHKRGNVIIKVGDF